MTEPVDLATPPDPGSPHWLPHDALLRKVCAVHPTEESA